MKDKELLNELIAYKDHLWKQSEDLKIASEKASAEWYAVHKAVEHIRSKIEEESKNEKEAH